jgi:hypothetical protein
MSIHTHDLAIDDRPDTNVEIGRAREAAGRDDSNNLQPLPRATNNFPTFPSWSKFVGIQKAKKEENGSMTQVSAYTASQALKISLNDLPAWSPWPSRIMGLSGWKVPVRNLDKIASEYDQDKYRKLLEWVEKQTGEISLAQAQHGLIDMGGLTPEKQICMSRCQELFLCTVEETFGEHFRELAAHVSPAFTGCRSVVELGSGAGFNLWYLKPEFPTLEFAGADFSGNAVKVAQRFHQNVVQFNFYEQDSYSFLEGLPEPIAVFTCHALEQLPTAAPFVVHLGRYRKRIKAVVNFEPVTELHSQETMLGLLRTRYTEMNDYNRDLLSAVRLTPGLEIDRVEYDVIGVNPLNPSSVLAWHFR